MKPVDPDYRKLSSRQLFDKEAENYRFWLGSSDFKFTIIELSVLFGVLISDGTLGKSAASFHKLADVIEPVILKHIPSMTYKLNYERKALAKTSKSKTFS